MSPTSFNLAFIYETSDITWWWMEKNLTRSKLSPQSFLLF